MFVHVPLTQTSEVPQTFPHWPQFALSVFVSAQKGEPLSPPQKVCPFPHVFEHVPLTQTRFFVHGAPHAPQFALSVFVYVQYGDPVSPPQNV